MQVDNENHQTCGEYLSSDGNNCELDGQMKEMQDVSQQVTEAELTEEALSQTTGGAGNSLMTGSFIGGGALLGGATGAVIHSNNGPNGRNAAIGAAGGLALGSAGAAIFLRHEGVQHTVAHEAMDDAIELITRR